MAGSAGHVVGLFAGGLVAAAVSVVIGLPALRVQGLLLAVTTLAFALVAQSWLLQQPWMLGDGENPGRSALVAEQRGSSGMGRKGSFLGQSDRPDRHR